ncbi:MAG: pyrimidine 5'-nucleotidase [Beijerinckiaceae bacterium]
MNDTKNPLDDAPHGPRAGASEASPLADTLSRIDTWVFDLDNTLYPASCDLWPKIDQRITLYLSFLFGLDGMSSRALQKYYYQRYGTTLRGLMEEHGIGPEGFLDFTHDIDRSSLLPDLALASAITALPGRKLILTNGSREHAVRTASALGLETMFEDIFDIADADFVPKPAAQNYERFFERHAVDPVRAVMFEDLAENLIIPHVRGMTTVLVVPKPGQLDHREVFEITHHPAPPYIDYVTSDLARFLRDLLDAPHTTDV